MTNNKRIATVVLWIARIWGLISLFFVLFMVGAHIIGSFTGEESNGGFSSTSELLSFIAFPVSIIIGLALAYKWEGLGGFITIAGMIIFHIIRPDLIFDPMISLLAAPGLIYILYWWMNRRLLK